MAIVNRDHDNSERRVVIPFQLAAVTTTGGTYLIAPVPFACEVKAIRLAVSGISTNPVFEVEGYKFSGGITINSAISTATSILAFGTSGSISLPLGTAGSTQVQLDANSQLVLTCTNSASAAALVTGTIVVEKLQDIVTYFGV